MRRVGLDFLLGALFVELSLAVKLLTEFSQLHVEIFWLIYRSRSPLLDLVMYGASRYGRDYVWIPLVFFLWLLGGMRYKKTAFLLAVTLLLAIPLGVTSKALLAQPSPSYGLPNLAFPSGHAVIVSAGAIVLVMKLPKKLSLPFLFESMLVSYSRIYIGVHWPLDVVGGWLLGGFCASLIISQEGRLDRLFRIVLGVWERLIVALTGARHLN